MEEYEEKKMIEQITAAEVSAKTTEGSKMSERAAGVAVVKTIAKQTRQQKKNQIVRKIVSQGSNDSIDDVILNLQDEAERYLQLAAFEHDHPDALVSLGNEALLEKNNIQTAVKYYERAAKIGSGEAYFNLGHLYWNGYENENGENENDFIADQVRSIEYFKKAIDCGDADAMYFIGFHLIQKEEDFDDELRNAFESVFSSAFLGSDDVRNNNKERRKFGFNMIHHSSMKGHGEAYHFLALLHRNGDDELDIESYKDNTEENKFHEYVKKAVMVGSPSALFMRGNCYYLGEDRYEKNSKFALNDFLEASDLGHADSTLCAGVILFQGDRGITPDRQRAFDLYQKAGELGSVEGWRNVAACYLTGEGVPKNEHAARHIYSTMVKQHDTLKEEN